MVQPRPIVQRVHAAPAVEENHDRRRRRLRRVRLEDPVLLIARAVAVLRHPGMHILFAAWTGIRLRWWSRSLCESSEGECEQNCKTDDFTSHISLGLTDFTRGLQLLRGIQRRLRLSRPLPYCSSSRVLPDPSAMRPAGFRLANRTLCASDRSKPGKAPQLRREKTEKRTSLCAASSRRPKHRRQIVRVRRRPFPTEPVTACPQAVSHEH